MDNTALLILFVVMNGCFQHIKSQVCTENGRIAGLDVQQRYSVDHSSDNTIILNEYGGINCYGVVTEWKFYKTSTCHEVYFQIWRPDAGGSAAYKLIGQNLYDKCPNGDDGEVTLRIAAHEQIPVEPGDFIGWTHETQNDMIQYDDGTNSTQPQDVIEICDGAVYPMTPGNSTANCQVNTPTPHRRDVSLQVKVVTGPAPVFDNLPNIVYIPENSMPGVGDYPVEKVFDVKASIEKNVVEDTIAIDVPLTFDNSNLQPQFQIITEQPLDGNLPYTGRVELTEKLDYETQQEFILNIRVDGLGQFSESTLTVRVIDINEEHVITNLDAQTTISAETARAGDVVFQVDVYDDDANPDPLVYAIDSTDILDPPPPFYMENKTGILRVSEDLYGGEWADNYILGLAAWDFMYKVTGTLQIHLTNIRQPPVIQNLNTTIAVPENAPTGSDIFQVVAEGRYPDELVYTIEGVQPFDMYNKFVIDAQSGWIRTTANPDFDYGDQNQWPIYILVGVTDSVGFDNGTLTINLEWVNRPPVFCA